MSLNETLPMKIFCARHWLTIRVAQVVRDRRKVGNSCIRRTSRLPRALRQWRRQNYSCVVQKVTNVHKTRGMNMMKVNDTHIHVVYEKIKALHYFRFAAEGLIFFVTISISYTVGKRCRILVYILFM